MEIFREIDNYWQRLQVGVLFTSYNIRRYVSQCKALQEKGGKIKYLQEWVGMLAEEIKKIHQGYNRMTEKDTNILTKRVFLYMADLKKREKLLRGLSFSLRMLQHPEEIKEGDITPEMIDQARNYPLGDLVELNKNGFAHCVNHPDKHPSMFCRNNFAYCYSCGWTGDSISVYMCINKVNFVQAVKELTREVNYGRKNEGAH